MDFYEQYLSPEGIWTVALVTPAEDGRPERETHFGLFDLDGVITAVENKNKRIRVMEDQRLEARRIRSWPEG